MQFIVIAHQLQITLYAAVFGIAFSCLYDILRVMRMLCGVTPVSSVEIKLFTRLPSLRRKKRGRLSSRLLDIFAVQLPDLFYGIFLAVSFCIFLFCFNSGRFRWFLLFAAAGGFFAYYFSVGRLTMYLSGYIISIVKSVLGFLLYLTATPLKWLAVRLVLLLKPLRRLMLRLGRLLSTERIRKKLSAAVALE